MNDNLNGSFSEELLIFLNEDEVLLNDYLSGWLLIIQDKIYFSLFLLLSSKIGRFRFFNDILDDLIF